MRVWMDKRFRDVFKNKSNVAVLSGNFEDRFIQAQAEINQRFPDLVQAFQG